MESCGHLCHEQCFHEAMYKFLSQIQGNLT
jgi:hypothetical protein